MDLPDILELDLVRCIQIDALWCVQRDLDDQSDGDFTLRSIQRWFSKTFHMPLPHVEELPLPYVLQHYYEESYGDMSEWDFQEAVKRAIATKEEITQIRKEEQEEFDAEERFMEEAKQEATDTTKASKEMDRVQEQLKKFRESVDLLGGSIKASKASKSMSKQTEEPEIELIGDALGDLPEIEGPDDLFDNDIQPLATKSPVASKSKW